MQRLLHLLFSILSALLTSFILSFTLLFRSVFLGGVFHIPSSNEPLDSVSLYEGTIWHERRRPVHHSFRYAVRYSLIDLDNTSHVLLKYLSADQARELAGTTGPVFLLTIPSSVGYEQNPLSVYYCYDFEDSQNLKKCIAQVTNTPWGERVSFVFNPYYDLVAKPLHVSPFMDMIGNWCIKTNAPGDNIFVGISIQHPTLGEYFSAALTAKKIPTTSCTPDYELFFWLMPHKIAFWIYWHAVKLWWKNVGFVMHPKYTSPSYRVEACARDHKLQGCATNIDVSDSECKSQRSFRWRDAKWPWA